MLNLIPKSLSVQLKNTFKFEKDGGIPIFFYLSSWFAIQLIVYEY